MIRKVLLGITAGVAVIGALACGAGASSKPHSSFQTVGPSPLPPGVMGDGAYVIGTDYPAGTYRAASTESLCYWQVSDRPDNGVILKNGTGVGNFTVVLNTHQYFETTDCGTWAR